MGGVAKQHKSHSKVRSRRANLKLKKPSLVKCPNCGNLILPHKVCPYCGYYKGKMEIDIFAKLTKKEKKLKEKELKERKETENIKK